MQRHPLISAPTIVAGRNLSITAPIAIHPIINITKNSLSSNIAIAHHIRSTRNPVHKPKNRALITSITLVDFLFSVVLVSLTRF